MFLRPRPDYWSVPAPASPQAVSSEARLRAMFDESPLGISLVDREGYFVESNPALRRILGYAQEELAGLRFRDLSPYEDVAESLGLFQDLYAGRIRNYTVEKRYIRKDGEFVWVRLTAAGVRDAQGAVQYVMGMAEDITARKAAEAALAEREEQLRQAQKMEAVGQLAGGIAHDFNNLLTVIRVHAELLTDVLREGDERSDLETIQHAAARAANLTRQLLAFSRKQLLQPRVLDPNVVVAGLTPMLRRLIGEDIALATILAPSVGRVLADPGQLEQVLLNLAVNARDAMPQGGALTIETADVEIVGGQGAAPDAASPGGGSPDGASREASPPGAYVMIAVSDTGIGMSPDIQARAFEPFFTTKEPGRGSGLGLSTVYGIVRQSSGYVRVASAPAAGATFRVYLPRQEPSAAAADERGAAAPEAGRDGGTVLVVEDEDAVRQLTRRILVRHGYDVLEARHGRDALDLVARHGNAIDLVLTDVVMPEMSGREFAEAFGRLRPGTPVVYMSGYTDDEILRRGLLDPGVPFLQKPFTATELAERVRTLIEGDR